MARLGENGAQRGVETVARRNYAETARSDESQTVSMGGVAPGSRGDAITQTRSGDQERRWGSTPAQFSQQFGNGGQWGSDDRQIRDPGQIGNARPSRQVLNLSMAAADQKLFALEAAAQ